MTRAKRSSGFATNCLTLEERLARQQSNLHGASEDVARGIDVQIRKARGQATRLTKNLEMVSSGKILGIRAHAEHSLGSRLWDDKRT